MWCMVKNVFHATFRLFLKWHKVKKSNFQATLPYCTPVLLRKTAPLELRTIRVRPVKLVLNELLLRLQLRVSPAVAHGGGGGRVADVALRVTIPLYSFYCFLVKL